MNKNIAVKLQNISKVYKLYDKPIDRLKESIHPFKKNYHKDFYALKNINLEIKKGEVLGIVGVNGAGKSTLLKIISGVMSPSSGRVNINGRINAILELGSGLKPEMTGRQNIKLSLQINVVVNHREEITQEIIEFADIGEYIDQPIKTYSSGMKARLGFAIATSTDPDVLIIDEVLAVGDVLFQRKCYEKIEELFKDGKTVIFVSHSAQSIVEFCSRAVLLYDREIVLDSTPKNVTDFYQKIIFSSDDKNLIDKLKGDSTLDQEGQRCLDKQGNNYNINRNQYKKTLIIKPKVINNINIELKQVIIIDNDNLIVNQLETGRQYRIYLKAKLYEFFEDFTFGIAISNVKGVSLSCTREYFKDRIDLNVNNNVLEFFWNFKCNFLEGRYFIKIDFREGRERLLYQGTDMLMFEVCKLPNNKYQIKACMMFLEQKCEVVNSVY